ncbi:hypothetical protein BJF78_09545 [Pseudonocardia sp. CNS-139]|nr:hypothetical protein BJF78_09545 [Pseudonocardia sp. CNS-139]
MTEVTIGLADDVRDELAAQAARSGQSLEDYITDELRYLAGRSTSDHWVAQVREQAGRYGAELTVEELLADKDADRR